MFIHRVSIYSNVTFTLKDLPCININNNNNNMVSFPPKLWVGGDFDN